MGVIEVLVFGSLFWGLGLFVLYWIIRVAVHHGTLDAARHAHRDQGRDELPLDPDGSPNPRS